MVSVTITLTDVVEKGRPTVKAKFALDRQGTPLSSPATQAISYAVAFKELADNGTLDSMLPLILTKLRYERQVGGEGSFLLDKISDDTVTYMDPADIQPVHGPVDSIIVADIEAARRKGAPQSRQPLWNKRVG